MWRNLIYFLLWKSSILIKADFIFPHSSLGKESACNAGDHSLIPGLGRSTGEGIGCPFQNSWASLVAQLVKKNYMQCRRPRFNPWVGKIPWRRERLPTPVSWPGEFHGLFSPWGCKESDTTEQLSFNFILSSWASLVAQMVKNLPSMQEIQVQSLGWENHLEKEMSTHSNILAWRIPWTEEPGGLQAMGSQWVGHNTTERLILSFILSQWTNIHTNPSDVTNLTIISFPLCDSGVLIKLLFSYQVRNLCGDFIFA